MDFSMVLFLATVVTGLIWLWDISIGAPGRRGNLKTTDVENLVAVESGSGTTTAAKNVAVKTRSKEPLVVEYAKAFFPVIMLVFLLRSFVVEPFRIPSGSMLPTLHIGDFILVNKFIYGIRLPVVNEKVIETKAPERGDVMVFRFPHNPTINFIKRVVGLPGDKVVFEKKKLYVNDVLAELSDESEYKLEKSGLRTDLVKQIKETLDGIDHNILLDNSKGSTRTEVTVPDGHYFVMGDNRDHSNDSRFWGFVPEDNIVGQAFFIWFNWRSDGKDGSSVDWSRIGSSID